MTPGASLSIIHPWDPWKQAVGGFDTCIDGILRTAPFEWPIELIGFTSDPQARPIGRWLDLEFDGRPVRFFAAHAGPKVNRVNALPLSLRFVAACRGRGARATGKIVQFHRFESSWAVQRPRQARAVYFLHNHPPAETRSAMTDVRWKSLPGVHQRLLCARLRQASVVVTVDPKTPAWLETVLPDLNGGIVALPQWADPGVFHSPRRDDRMAARRRFRERLGLPAESRIVLFAGRLESQKDPLLLVRAFAAVAGAVPEAVLVFLGEGRLAMPVEAAAKDLRIAARVRVSGAVLRSDLAEAYVSSDVVACSSAFESGPRVMFEALACGTPVVSFDVGQIGAILERNPEAGVLVRPRETLSLAAALGQVLSRSSDPDLPARCAAAVREFVPERSLAKLFFCYREWLNGKNR